MTKKLLTAKEFLLFIFLIAFSLILSVGGNFSYACIDGIKLWFACVFPSLFPYLFITAILTNLSITARLSKRLSPITKRLFNTGGISGFALIISLVSGYPLGAKTVADLKEKGLITDAESVRCAAFCSTSSPMFLIGSVGSIMFNSKTFGLALFLVHFLSAIIVGVIFSFYKRKEKPCEKFTMPLLKNSNNLLYDSVYQAVISVLIVGGLITIFYVLTEVLLAFNILTPAINLLSTITQDDKMAESLVLGVFECTRALKSLSQAPQHILTLPIAAALCGFGGGSVIVQSVSYLKKAKIKTALFILAKIISAAINFIIGLIISLTVL